MAMKATAGIKAMTFPNTTRKIRDIFFYDKSGELQSVVLNEGLEVLGWHLRNYCVSSIGVFTDTSIRRITLPSTLKKLRYCTFSYCQNLCRVTTRGQAPAEDGEAILPEKLEAVEGELFDEAWKIKAVWVENDSVADQLRKSTSDPFS